jgi:hypothetical protein
VEDELGIFARKPIHDCRDESRHHDFGASESYFTGSWIGQGFDTLDALSQIIEHSDSAVQQSAPIDRWFDAAGAAIEQSDA